MSNQHQITASCVEVLRPCSATRWRRRRPIRQGTEPKARNLRGLGIDPAEFRKINHYH